MISWPSAVVALRSDATPNRMADRRALLTASPPWLTSAGEIDCCSVSNAPVMRKCLSSRSAHVVGFTPLAQASSQRYEFIPSCHIPAAHEFDLRRLRNDAGGRISTMKPARDQLFRSSLSDVPTGPSDARDD